MPCILIQILKIIFLWWWEKNVEYRLEYYAEGKDDATRALQYQINLSQWVYLKPGSYSVKAPVSIRGDHKTISGSRCAWIDGGIEVDVSDAWGTTFQGLNIRGDGTRTALTLRNRNDFHQHLQDLKIESGSYEL